MKETKISIRYAKALFELALEQGIEDRVKEDMIVIKDVCRSNNELIRILISPVIKVTVKDKILKSIFAEHIHKLSMSFISLIVRKGRESLVVEIACDYVARFKEFKGIKTAYIKTAKKIDEKTRQQLIEKLQTITQAQIELVEEIKEDLVGGYILKIDDNQYDASILSRLKRLKRDFKDNLYVKGF